MKKSFAVFLALIVASATFAQNYYRAEQQAQRVSQQNDAEQQRIANAARNSGGQSAAAPTAPATPADPVLQATVANISGLQADFGAVTSGKTDASQKISLLNDLSQAAQGKKASSDSVKKLTDDLLAAISGKTTLAAAQQKQLAAFVHASFNSAHLTDAQTGKIFDNAQKILTQAGVASDVAANVIADLKTIAAETK